MTPVLQLQDLSVSVDGCQLIHGISFSIGRGERVALLGASGSGKSLTASALLGQLPAGMQISGSLRIDGKDVPLTSRRRADGKGLAAIQQNPLLALNPLVRLGAQLAIPLQQAGLTRQEAHKRALSLLGSVGLDDPARVLTSYSGELSGGQLQRVCIALALGCNGSLLVADEPTTALDVVSQAKVLEVLAGPATAEQAMLFITHDLTAAEVLCTRALVMEQGRIVEEATMKSLLTHPQHSYTVQLVQAARTGFKPVGVEAAA